jgi:hypothetical protein
MRHRKASSPLSARQRFRLQVEQLERRELLSISVLESFESGELSNYRSYYHFVPSVDVVAAAAHNGTPGLGLVKHDGFEWFVNTNTTVQRGQTISVWGRFADAADGRLYFGFGYNPQGDFQSTAFNTSLALTLAGNTNQLLIQRLSGNATPTVLGSVAQTYAANQWYRLEVEWAADGGITGRLYGSDGTTLLNTVTGTDTTITQGNIAFRGFGSDKYFDTVVLDDDSSGTAALRASAGGSLPAGWAAGVAPPARINLPVAGPSALPWQYKDALPNASGLYRDVAEVFWGSLTQVVRVGDVVALSAGNISQPTSGAGSIGVDWGPQWPGPATPLLFQYIFRRRPGEATTLIGIPPDAKHFFAPSVLNPGVTDAYDAIAHNANQSLMTPGYEVDLMTGALHRPTHQVTTNNDGINSVSVSHAHGSLDHRLQVPIADLDPAQNPVGTQWWTVVNVYVEGDIDVTNNSRWVRIQPNWNGSTFTFSYPEGTAGNFNFRNIPGLVEPTLPISIIDNGGAGFSTAGAGWSTVATGYGGSVLRNSSGSPSNSATYSFTGLTPGYYRVSFSYPADAALGIMYADVSSGGTTLASRIPVNNTIGPADFTHGGANWKNLGNALYNVTGTTLTVTLYGANSGGIQADAVRIERNGLVVNQPPDLMPIADQTIPASQATVMTTLSATDPEGSPITYSATATSLAHYLDVVQGYDFFTSGDFFFDFYGQSEKWVQSTAIPSGWALLFPTGELRAWDGSGSATGALLGNVGRYYYDDPNRLINVLANPFATVSVNPMTGALTVTRMPTSTISAIRVTGTATDAGGLSDSQSFNIIVTSTANQPPTLAAIPNQTIPASQATVMVTLMGADPDGDPLTYSATATSLARVRDQTYDFFTSGDFFENSLGAGEKWVQSAAIASGWAFILPSGELFAWDGSSSATGMSLGIVGQYYHTDPNRLINVPTTPHATVSVMGSQLTVTRMPTSTISAIVVTAMVSDGMATASQMFTITVTASANQPPTLAAIPNQTIPSSQATVMVTLMGADPDGDPLTYSATATSLARLLDEQYNFFTTGDFFQNFLGLNEKWVQSAALSNGWAYILPNGELYEWNGATSGTLRGNVGAYYWTDPNRLIDVPTTAHATVSVVGSQLTVTRMPTSTISAIVVTAMVSDGMATASRMFTITVTV